MTYSARGALQILLDSIGRTTKRRTVLLPAFHCTTVVDAVLVAGFTPRFYAVTTDIAVDMNDLLAKIDDDVAAVLIVHYFGFRTPLEPLLAEKRQGAPWVLIEDWAHSFLSGLSLRPTGGDGDYTIYSFYKLAPTSVGGGLRMDSSQDLSPCELRAVDGGTALTLGKNLVEQMIAGVGGADILNSLSQMRMPRQDAGENGAGEGSPQQSLHFRNHAMPWMSRLILGMSNIEKIVSERRRNYECWSAELRDGQYLRKWKPMLPDDVCPWGYPVFIEDRSFRDRRWRTAGVPLFTFGETLHFLLREADHRTKEAARYLSNAVLMLGVDRLLSVDQIQHSAAVINADSRTT